MVIVYRVCQLRNVKLTTEAPLGAKLMRVFVNLVKPNLAHINTTYNTDSRENQKASRTLLNNRRPHAVSQEPRCVHPSGGGEREVLRCSGMQKMWKNNQYIMLFILKQLRGSLIDIFSTSCIMYRRASWLAGAPALLDGYIMSSPMPTVETWSVENTAAIVCIPF